MRRAPAGSAHIQGGGSQGERWRGGHEGKHGSAWFDRPALGATSELTDRKVAGIGLMTQPNRMPQPGLKPKDLCGIPWRVAFALQADGWWLRQDIIWSKPNPMPESVSDRCTKAHEYLFLLSKRERYFYDARSIAESVTWDEHHRNIDSPSFSAVPGASPHRGLHKSSGNKRRKAASARGVPCGHDGTVGAVAGSVPWEGSTRNKRSVWTVTTRPFAEAHFATFPPALIEPCILAGCPEGGMVLDPFAGAGTTGLVAERLGRSAILIELNPNYAAMAERRIRGDAPLFADVRGA
jgi:hypothetical protein